MDPIDAQIRQVLTKREPDAAFRIAAETRAYLTQRGIRLSGEHQTKIEVVQPGLIGVIGDHRRAGVYGGDIGLGEAIAITFDFRSDTPGVAR